jgi:hypothetical protein
MAAGFILDEYKEVTWQRWGESEKDDNARGDASSKVLWRLHLLLLSPISIDGLRIMN